MSEPTPCWVTNAQPGLRVGTAVLALDLPAATFDNGQTPIVVADAEHREFTVFRASLTPMLAEEIDDGAAEAFGFEAAPLAHHPACVTYGDDSRCDACHR